MCDSTGWKADRARTGSANERQPPDTDSHDVALLSTARHGQEQLEPPIDQGAEMTLKFAGRISFARLPEVSPGEILAHMSDPRIAEHMPLLSFVWDEPRVAAFVSAKEACWQRDGLGHWAILSDGAYVGWGGFHKEGDEWDYGLVLKPDCFGLGLEITRIAIRFARADERIPFVTFLLPPSRRHLRGLERLGARYVAEVEHEGAGFLKYRLDTA